MGVIHRQRIVDTRTKAIQIPPQDVITHDNISISVDAVVYASVASPGTRCSRSKSSCRRRCSWLDDAVGLLGKVAMDEIFARRDGINVEIRKSSIRVPSSGRRISAVEIEDIQLPPEMQRAMARQAEAERERRAKVIAAQGEVQAASKLAQAASMTPATPAHCSCGSTRRWSRSERGVIDDRLSGADRPLGRRPDGSSPQQIQGMMTSAAALASGEKAKQLAAAANADDLAGRRKRRADADAGAQSGDPLVPARRT